MAHFEREDQDRQRAALCHVGGDVQGEGRLSHGRAGTHDDERRLLQTQDLAVEVGEAGGYSGELHLGFESLLQLIGRDLQEFAQWSSGVDDTLLGHGEHPGLGIIECLGHVVGFGVREFGDLAGHTNEATQRRGVEHDLGVTTNVADDRRGVLQLQKEVEATNFFQQSDPTQFVGHGHRIDGFTHRQQRTHGVEDVLVGRLVKMFDADAGFRCGVHRVARQQHRAEERLFGVEVVWWNARCHRARRTIATTSATSATASAVRL